MQDLLGDVRYAIRQLTRTPGFTTTVLLTLVLGVGGTTSIFSCVYGLLLKGLPFTNADRIVTISDTDPQVKGTIEASFPEYLDWRTQQTSFSQMAAYADRGTAVLSFDGKSQQVHQVLASGDFFTLLGTGARLGRVLQMQDNRPGSDHCQRALYWARSIEGKSNSKRKRSPIGYVVKAS